MQYTASDLIAIKSRDNKVLFHFRSVLGEHFATLRNFLDEYSGVKDLEIPLDFPAETIRSLLRFVDVTATPYNAVSWANLLDLADFLEPNNRIVQELIADAVADFEGIYENITKEDFSYYTGPMTNPNVTLREASDEYMQLVEAELASQEV